MGDETDREVRLEKERVMTTQFFDVVETYFDEPAQRRLRRRKVTGSLLIERDADLVIELHNAAADRDTYRAALEALADSLPRCLNCEAGLSVEVSMTDAASSVHRIETSPWHPSGWYYAACTQTAAQREALALYRAALNPTEHPKEQVCNACGVKRSSAVLFPCVNAGGRKIADEHDFTEHPKAEA